MKVKKIILTWLSLVFFFLFIWALRLDFIRRRSLALNYSPRLMPQISSEVSLPELSAKSYLVIDLDSGLVLTSKNPHLRLHPASITKMATAITVLESYPLDEVITVRQEYLIGKNMGLEVGERITVKNLIYGLLVHSANDAGFVLAGQSEEKINQFIERMNNFIQQLGLEDTHFVNFDGLEDVNHYSTSFDLAHLARFALKNKVFAQSIKIKQMKVSDINDQVVHHLETTNELLIQIPEVKGIKTGWTPQSGECFIGLIEINDKRLITVILGSEDRFGETVELINWIKKSIDF